MNRTVSIVTIVLTTLLTILALAACQQQQGSAPAATVSPPSAAPTPTVAVQPTQAAPVAGTAVGTAVPETLKLGLMLPLSGPSSRGAMITDRFVRMGMDDVNTKGGVQIGGKTYRFDVVTVDDKYSAEGGREAANRLVLADKVKIILGGISSSVGGAQPITEPNKVLLLPLSASDANLGPKYPLTLMMSTPHQRMRSGPLYDWLVKAHPEVKRIGLINPDEAGGRSLATITQAVAQERGLSIIAQEYFPLEIKDFGPVVTRLLRANPDAIDLGRAAPPGPTLLGVTKALYEQGYRKPVFAATTVEMNSLLQGGPATEGFVWALLADYNVPPVSEKEKDVIRRYVTKYGASELELGGIQNYNYIAVLAQAMSKAGTVDNTEKIATVLREGEWELNWGKGRFVGVKTYGLPTYLELPVYLSKVEGGKVVTFDSFKGTLP